LVEPSVPSPGSKFELYDLISPDVIMAADLANIGEGEQ